jgi:hypothetical protein
LQREHLKQELLLCVQEEVVARKHLQREISRGLLAPAFKLLAAHFFILQAAKNGEMRVAILI